MHMAQRLGVVWAMNEGVFELLALQRQHSLSVPAADLTVYKQIDSLELQTQKCKNRL